MHGYPWPRTHDYAQRRKTLTTYGTTNATTTWISSPDSGLLIQKNYAGESNDGPGNAADYTYNTAGRLKNRTWERDEI